MSEQNTADGWRVLVERRAANGAKIQTTYLAAISDKDAMCKAVLDELKLGPLELIHCEPVSAAVLKEYRVPAGKIVEVMVIEPR